MTPLERVSAVDAIRRAKARYFRGVDSGDGDLVRSVLAEHCVLDYRGCCTDPASGEDFLPAMNIVLEGRANWLADGLSRAGIVSVHQGHDADIVVEDDDRATAIFAMTDRLWMPAGAPYRMMTGHGFYHETYVRSGEQWLIATLRISRLRVEADR